MKRVLAAGALALCAGCDVAAPPRPSSVVLVTIDTLRADRARGPNLDALARSGARFENAFAQSPLTLPSHGSILTGTYPTVHGVRDNGRYRLPDEMETLAEMLKAKGYATAAFVGGFPLDSRFGLHQGFDLYDDVFGRAPSRVGLAERPASRVVASARRWIAERGGDRYFAWVHLFDPHAPYEPPAPFPSGYEGEVAYVDHALKELFDAVSKDTLVVVTADHGEGLGDHGERTHSLFVYDSTLRVPLLLRGPGVPEEAVVEETVRSIDVLPTVLDLLGQEGTCARCQGRSLVPLLRGQRLEPVSAYAETFFPRLNLGWSELRSLRKGGWKYIEAPEPELYHVESDPDESRNVAWENEERLRDLASELERFAEGDELSAPSADEETVAALRSLGYLTSKAPPEPPAAGPRRDPKNGLEVWEKVREGMGLVAEGRMDEAIETLGAVIREEPDLILARAHLALALFDRGRYPESMEQATAILERQPNDFDATLLLGKSLARLGKLPEAREVLEAASRIDSRSPEPWVELAQLDLAQGSREGAEASLAKARERDERAVSVRVLGGKLAMLRGEAAEAERLFRAALADAPFEEEPRTQLGNLLLTQRRLSDAEALFEEGLAMRPDAAAFHVGLGHGRALAGRVEEAIRAFEKALELEPRSTLVLNSLAFAYLEKGDSKRGLDLLRRSLEIEPVQPELRSLLRQGR